MYMSRLAAQKEWAFMKVNELLSSIRALLKLSQVLHEHGFPVPRPIDQARHCILMGFIDAYPLSATTVQPSIAISLTHD